MGKTDGWRACTWYCSNCGNPVSGYLDAEGKVKAECSRCHAVMVRIKKSRRQDQVSIYCPGQVKSN